MISLDRAICRDAAQGQRREWLVTNGLGGYASGTLAMPTRRYHALLVASLQPPIDRRVCLARLEERLTWSGRTVALDGQEYADGTVTPRGYEGIQAFWLEQGLPTWRYAMENVVLERRLWMPHGQNATILEYRLLAAPSDVTLELTPLVAWRDHHALQRSADAFPVEPAESGVLVALDDRWRLALHVPGVIFTAEPHWHSRFWLPEEAARGYDASEDLFQPGRFTVTLAPGGVATLWAVLLAASAQPDFVPWSLSGEHERRTALLHRAGARAGSATARLVLAADQFLVRRGTDRMSVIAGYPWFADWGRDTMIALPGLTLATGRFDDCRSVLRTWSDLFADGLLPNVFPDHGEAPDYHCADAALWFVEAAAAYVRTTGDRSLQEDLFPILSRMVEQHLQGTHDALGVDPSDGLLRAVAPGRQLTWMDAKVGDWVVTPRRGKPVELSALWYNALTTLAGWAIQLGRSSAPYVEAAERCSASFNERFWYEAGGYLYDVVDGETGDDPTLRPNQLFAVSLFHPVLWTERRQSVVDVIGRDLLTPVGLRTLDRLHPRYRGVYEGDPAMRDAAYHQGTVWPWLLGAYVDAHLAVYHDVGRARAMLLPLLDHLPEGGIGSISEIFDGDAPHRPRGCIAQAWSVAELLRLWRRVGGD